MYICKNCGNKKYFTEINNIKTFVVLDEETGEIVLTNNDFVECLNVSCDVCKTSSEDKGINDKK